MAVTRIKNNQVTDAATGNTQVGINAGTKLQNYSITAGKIANNLTYGSDLTITGNLTVQGTTTNVDTVNTLIQDPLITLADGQTAGTPTLDIGTIGLRGSQNSAVLGWKESAKEFVTALSTTTVSNTTFTITSYANLHSGNTIHEGTTSLVGNLIGAVNATATITGGNLATPGTASAAGNVTGGNVLTGGLVSATATITGGNLATGGTASATGTITGGNLATGGTASATGNITGGNILTGGVISATGTITAANITGANILTAGYVSATGNISGANVNATGNIVPTANVTYNLGSPTAQWKSLYISGSTIYMANMQLQQPAGTANTLQVTGPDGSTLGGVNVNTISAQGNITGGNLLTGGILSATGAVTSGANITGANILTAGSMSSTGNATHGNILTGGLISATATVTGGNLATGGTVSATGNITGAANVSGGNLLTGGLVSATATVTGGNLATGGTASATGNIDGGNLRTAGLVTATGNVVGNSLVTGGRVYSAGAMTITNGTGNINLSPTGNIVLNNNYINSIALNPVQDQDVASKYYVDTMAASGLSYHTPVVAATVSNSATTTGGTTTYTQPNGVSNGVGAYIQTTGSWNLIDTANVQTANTRILIKNEANAVWNGVYGWANATTIVRTTDTDEYGPNSVEQLSLNDYFFVTSGNVNAGSAWVVNSPTGTITFGSSNITFAQFSSSQTYTAGNGISIAGTVISARVDNTTTAFDGSQNIIVKAGAQLTTPNIGAATGTSLSVTGTVTAASTVGGIITGSSASTSGNITGGNINTGGTVSATGNITGNYYFGNGSQLTGVSASTSGFPVIAGTSNIAAATNGNVAVTVGGISNVLTVTTTGIVTSGTSSVSGNITGANVNTGGLVSATGNVTGGNLLAGTSVSATATITGGNLATGGTASATGNVTGGNVLTGGAVSATGTITGGNINTAGSVSATGNVSAGNINLTGASTAASYSATGNVTSGNVLTGGLVSATATVTGGNLATGGTASATGNITGGNILTGGLISATGNVTGGNVIGGNVVITGNAVNMIAAGGTLVHNSSNANTNFAVNGTAANVFFVNATTNTASFGSSTQTTNALVAFNSTNSILIPVGATNQRPATGVTGMMRFNSFTNSLEVYNNTTWQGVGSTIFTVITDEQFNGDGTTTAFTLSSAQTTASVIVSINGVVQIPTSAYSVSGTTLTFTEAPATGDLIDVRELTTTTTVTNISNTNGNAVVATYDNSNVVQVTGSMTISGDLSVTGNATLSGNIIGDRVTNGTTSFEIQTASGNANITVGGTSNTAVFSPTALTLATNLMPAANVTYNLGSTTQRWNDLWLANSTIYMGNASISANATSLVFTNPGGGQTVFAGATAGLTGATVSVTGNITGGNLSVGTGTITGGNIVNSNANGVGNIGSASTYFNTVFAKSTSAQYADLAEKYTADAAYAPGTVVVFGGTAEVTADSVDGDTKVAGVVSTNPSYIMNSGLEAEHVATVALTGRVPTMVVGPVRKGDMMVAAGQGRAKAEANPRVGSVIGKALEDFDGAEGTIEVVVGRF